MNEIEKYPKTDRDHDSATAREHWLALGFVELRKGKEGAAFLPLSPAARERMSALDARIATDRAYSLLDALGAGPHGPFEGQLVFNADNSTRPLRVGNVYEVAVRRDESGAFEGVWLGGHKYVGRPWQSLATALTWQSLATELSARASARASALSKTHSKAQKQRAVERENLVHKALAPLRDAYSTLSTSQRAELLAEIIRYVTGGRS